MLEDAECTGDDGADVGCLVEDVLEEYPDGVVPEADLGDLDVEVHLVAGFEYEVVVLLGDIEDAGQGELEELFVAVVVDEEECLHLGLEDDVVVLVDFGAEALLAQEVQYHFGCCHSAWMCFEG